MARIEKPKTEKGKLHPRNRHQGLYHFPELMAIVPELKAFVMPNHAGVPSIDFGAPEAVKALNRALLKKFYNVEYWDIPKGYLCPPIPGRADYLHYAADLLAKTLPSSSAKPAHFDVPKGSEIRVLDIGVGANCVYPIIGTSEYGWSFVGSDVHRASFESASKIVELNEKLKQLVEIRFQANPDHIFKEIIHPGETFHLSICNPPFHTSEAEAGLVNARKSRNLGKAAVTNFGGQNNELWCEGGEVRFIQQMILESKEMPMACLWFTAFVSKEASLGEIYQALRSAKVSIWETIEMAQGQKKSRFVAWSFQIG